ncbi:MAG: anaerobic C4-dicarboxylate transporter [Succinivibrio sp.]|nr:anaerobic C4-dicarboxylate transporter [Succinivibrio sp.]
MLIAEFVFLLLMLYLGSRYGGIGLGVVSGVGLLVEVFVLRMPPASPPIDVMLIILAVVTCASILEAAGGLKYMLQIAERILRRNPRHITFLGPLVTFSMSVMLGTGHAVYSIMPIIGDIAVKNKIRPERPMACASVASQLALTGSPIAAVVAVYLGQDVLQLPGLENLNLLHILCVTFPAVLCGTLAMALYSNFRGKELYEDPGFLKRLEDPNFKAQLEQSSKTMLDEKLPFSAKLSVYLFLLALAVIVLVAMVPELRTVGVGSKPIGMGIIIQMMMLGFGGIILISCKTPVKIIPNGVVFKSGMVACIAIFGIAWMSDTYFKFAMPEFKAAITEMVQQYPWTFVFALFAVSVVVNSQAATAKILVPVALGIGLPGYVLIGLMPATYAYFFIPNYPSDIATVNFDITGTTKIGRYYFNHSFMVPGLIGVTVACTVGLSLARILI